jgi:hypothetical protein
MQTAPQSVLAPPRGAPAPALKPHEVFRDFLGVSSARVAALHWLGKAKEALVLKVEDSQGRDVSAKAAEATNARLHAQGVVMAPEKAFDWTKALRVEAALLKAYGVDKLSQQAQRGR